MATTVLDAATDAPWTGTETTGASALAAAAVTTSGPPAATGSVAYTFFASGACAAPPVSSQIVAAGTRSSPTGPLAAGSYSFEAVYSGDTNYTGSTSACEHFAVSPAATTTSTVLRDAAPPNSVILDSGSVPLATSVFDTASVSGQVDGKAITGTVTYHSFTAIDCSGTPTSELVPPGTPSSPTGPLAAGSYSFEAVYSGDTNYIGSTSACERFTVSPANTTTDTVLQNAADGSVIAVGGSVPPGTSVFDSATVNGVPGVIPTGTVTYTFFNHGQCTGGGHPAGGGDLAGGVPPNSSPVGPLATGTYAFKATYSGDVNYGTSTSACENFHVQLPAPQITRGGSTCQEFIAGTATPLTAGRYSVMGTTINGVNPGVFSYYTAVVAPGTSFTTSISQTNDSGVPPSYPNVPIDQHQVVVYNGVCQVVTSGVTVSFPSTGDAHVKIAGATTGDTYVVSVKYSLTSLKGQPVPPKNPLTYTFSTDLNGTMVDGSQRNLLFETP